MFKEQYEKLVAKFGKGRVMIGAVIIGLLVIGVLSKGVGQRANDSAAERAIEAATGGKVDVDSESGEVTVKTDQGTWSTSDKLPANWPSDVPVYPGAKVTASVAGAGDQANGSYASLESSDTVAAVIAWYKKEVPGAGWTVETDAMVSGSLMLSATKSERALSVTVTAEDGNVAIGLVVANK
jgi:hypothetical protein